MISSMLKCLNEYAKTKLGDEYAITIIGTGNDKYYYMEKTDSTTKKAEDMAYHIDMLAIHKQFNS